MSRTPCEPAPPLPPALRKALGEIYRRADDEIAATGAVCWLRGECCDFERSELVLFASSLEVTYVEEAHPEPHAPGSKACPFWKEGRCTERERRPLGCRTYFCDPSHRDLLQAIYEKYHREIQDVARSHEIPYRYVPFVAALRRTGCTETARPADAARGP